MKYRLYILKYRICIRLGRVLDYTDTHWSELTDEWYCISHDGGGSFDGEYSGGWIEFDGVARGFKNWIAISYLDSYP